MNKIGVRNKIVSKVNGEVGEDAGSPQHYDIIVVGASLVGAAFALRMARLFIDNRSDKRTAGPGKIALLEARPIPPPMARCPRCLAGLC